MKICGAILWFLLLGSLSAQAQSSSQRPSVEQQTSPQQPGPAPTPPAGQLKTDPAKEDDIRRLLELTGAKALVTQTLDGMEKGIKPLLANSLPPGERSEEHTSELQSRGHLVCRLLLEKK